MDIDSYLSSLQSLRQTESAQGTLLHPGQALDEFRVIAFLGRGATSEVWRVRHQRQDRDYALKIFTPPDGAPADSRQRFLTEARALDEFRHPNLMRRYLLKADDEHPYFTMDVLHPLSERITPRDLPRILNDILAGLDALHSKGIVHRDIKPSNILLADDGHAVLSDLGVAHIADTNLAKRLGDMVTPEPTLASQSPFVGTPRYAAPEQLAGEKITPATDIYSLGVVIEELLGKHLTLPWKFLVRRMTAARPQLRLQSAKQVRRRIQFIRILPKLAVSALGIGLAFALVLTVRLVQPSWTELPESLVVVQGNPTRMVINLDGGHYLQPSMRLQPLVGPAPANASTSTNAIDRQFQKMFSSQNRRYPVYITGHGKLKCPDLACCEIHLASGVTFITSGRFNPDGFVHKSETPPSDADWTHRIGYPAFVVEKGAELIFTENDAYPPSLIRTNP